MIDPHAVEAGMPNGRYKIRGTTFLWLACMCLAHIQFPKGAKTEAPKELRERNMYLCSVRNYLLGFSRTWCKKTRISAEDWQPC